MSSVNTTLQNTLTLEQKVGTKKAAMMAIIANHIGDSVSGLQGGIGAIIEQLKDITPPQPIEFGEGSAGIIAKHLDIEARVFRYVLSESDVKKIADDIGKLFRDHLSSPIPSKKEQEDAYRQYAEDKGISFQGMGIDSTTMTLTIPADEFLNLVEKKADAMFLYIVKEILGKYLLALKLKAKEIERKLFGALENVANNGEIQSQNILTPEEEGLRLHTEARAPIEVDTDETTPTCINVSLYGTGIPIISNPEQNFAAEASIPALPILRRHRQASHIQTLVFSPRTTPQVNADNPSESSGETRTHWTQVQPLHGDFRSIINLDMFAKHLCTFLDSLSVDQSFGMSYVFDGDIQIEGTNTPQRFRLTLLSTDEVAENIRKKTLQDTQDRTSDTVANIIGGSRWGQLVSYLKVRLVALASKLV